MRFISAPARIATAQRIPVVRLFTRVWFGVTMLTIILIYSSLVSAWPPLRWALELTEMQAYQHWFFLVSTGLFGAAILSVLLFRSRWIWLNAGSLTTHVGLLTLIVGSWIYFGTKIEGDVLLPTPRIALRAFDGSSERIVAEIAAEPGRRWATAMPGTDGLMALTVVNTWSADLQAVAAADVRLEMPGQAPRVISLRETGVWQPLFGILSLGLIGSPPREHFYDREDAALYVSNPARGLLLIANLPALPIHRDRYVGEREPLQDVRGNKVPSRRTKPAINLFGLSIPTGWLEHWRLPIEPDLPHAPFTVSITGYVPYIYSLRLNPNAAEGEPRMVPQLESTDRRDAGVAPRYASAIRLEVRGTGEHADFRQAQWMAFSAYPDFDARPYRVQMPGSEETWEIVYSRARHDLGATLSGKRMSVNYFPGRGGIDSFHSDFLCAPAGSSTAHAAEVATNQSMRVGPWTLYQARYAPDEWSYTVLGVGNHNGVVMLNVGWVLVTLGTLFAFYVKPILVRRARERKVSA